MKVAVIIDRPCTGLLNVAPASVVEDRKLESAMMGSRMACVSCQIPRKFAVISVILMS
jgi:hypothetical protein